MPVSSLSSVSRERPEADVIACISSREASSLPFITSPCTASRCTSGSESLNSGIRSLRPFGAAELAKEIRRRAADFPVRRVHQPLNRLAPLRPEPDEDVAQPAAGARVLFRREPSASAGITAGPMAWQSALNRS